MEEYLWPIVIGVAFGFTGRVLLLKTDYRQYPTQPHGVIIHLTLGMIAAVMGTIAVPALWEAEYAAVTFLALAAQQFREVRNMERETLTKIDETELIPRGKVYIEGIAMVFEGRNYLVIILSLLTTMSAIIVEWWAGIITGVICLTLTYVFKSGHLLGRIADIRPAQVRFEGADVFVGDIHIMNIGKEESRQIVAERALGFIISPKSVDSTITIANLGQRQAIIHDLSVGLGIHQDEDTPSLIPLTRRDLNDGRLAVYFIPHIKNVEHALQIIAHVPILENAVRIPSESDAIKNHGGADRT